MISPLVAIAVLEMDVYIHELKRCAAIAPCDHTLKQFVLQDVITECETFSPTALCLCLDVQSLSMEILNLCCGVHVTHKEHK